MEIILTCKIGKFTFEEGQDLSLMKVVRDTVMGQMLQPKQRTMVVETEEDAYEFIRSSDSNVIAQIQFKLELHEDYKSHQLESLLQALAEQANVSGKQLKDVASRFSLTGKVLNDMLNRYRLLSQAGVFV